MRSTKTYLKKSRLKKREITGHIILSSIVLLRGVVILGAMTSMGKWVIDLASQINTRQALK